MIKYSLEGEARIVNARKQLNGMERAQKEQKARPARGGGRILGKKKGKGLFLPA